MFMRLDLRRQLSSVYEWTATIIVVTIVVVHLGITWLYNSPPNFVKISMARQLQAYMGYTFSQDWSFFAPNPIDRNAYLLVRGADSSGRKTDWINVSIPLIRAVQRNRLSPYELINTGVSNAVFESKRAFSDLTKKSRKENVLKSYDLRFLYRVGAAVLLSRYAPSAVRRMQVGVLDERYPRFTRRRTSGQLSKRRAEVFNWVPIPTDVKPWN